MLVKSLGRPEQEGITTMETKLLAFLAFGAAFTTLAAWMVANVRALDSRQR